MELYIPEYQPLVVKRGQDLSTALIISSNNNASCTFNRRVINWLTCCLNPKIVLLLFCVVAFVQGLVISGFINVSISTLERRFHLQSSETGVIASCYDIGVVACIFIVTYVGGRGHKPIWIGWGAFIMGVGSILFSIPHFTAPTYVPPDQVANTLCVNASVSNCRQTSNLRAYRGMFIAAQLFHGVGASPVFTLALTYLDENVKQVYSATYHGIYMALSIMGPGIGYIAGGQFLKLYTYLGQKVNFPLRSPLWIGAWWLGFITFGCFAVLLSLPIQMFPHQLPNTEEVRKNREREMQRDKIAEEVRKDEVFGTRFRDIPKSFLVLFRNKTFIFLSLGGAMENAMIASTSTFGPKYLESIFTVSAIDAGLAFGALAIAGGFLGMFGGGIIVTKFKLSSKQMLRMCFICAFFAMLCVTIFLITCPNIDFAGGSVSYHGETSVGLEAGCNSMCGCSLELYAPICGSDGVTYFSPCFAGCRTPTLQNCTCVATPPNVTTTFAKPGRCGAKDCSKYSLFLGIQFLSIFLTFLSTIPALQVCLRSVPFHQRSFALGMQWVLLRVIGSIPGPIIYGAVLDLSCLVWNQECGRKGSCKMYDNFKMSRYIFALALSYKLAAFLFFLIAYFVYEPRIGGKVEATPDEMEKDNPAFEKEKEITKI